MRRRPAVVVGAPPPRGVDPELLRSLPVTGYRAADDVGLVECAVCLAGLEDGEEARFLPGCGHGFHAQCVDRWLAAHTTCPLCRVTVVGKPEASTPTSLPPVPLEPANYTGNVPASVLHGVSDQATLGAVTVATDGVLVIDVPESMMMAATPRDASKSPGVDRLRSVKRLWSFGRQGASGSTTPCAGGHGFHAQCVDRWLASHTTCPLCRVTVVGRPEASTPTSLPPVPPEPANYAANLPASVLLGVTDQATFGAVTVATDGVLVIDFPESMMVAATPRDASKSPGVAGLRSVKRLWSFGRQGPSGSTMPCTGGSGTADVERGITRSPVQPRDPRCSVEPPPGIAAGQRSAPSNA